jgi:hypothetical protein
MSYSLSPDSSAVSPTWRRDRPAGSAQRASGWATG